MSNTLQIPQNNKNSNNLLPFPKSSSSSFVLPSSKPLTIKELHTLPYPMQPVKINITQECQRHLKEILDKINTGITIEEKSETISYMKRIFDIIKSHYTPSEIIRRNLIDYILNFNEELPSPWFKTISFRALSINALTDLSNTDKKVFLTTCLSRIVENYIETCSNVECDFLMGDIFLHSWMGPPGIGKYSHASLCMENQYISNEEDQHTSNEKSILSIHCFNDLGCDVFRNFQGDESNNKLNPVRSKEDLKLFQEKERKKFFWQYIMQSDNLDYDTLQSKIDITKKDNFINAYIKKHLHLEDDEDIILNEKNEITNLAYFSVSLAPEINKSLEEAKEKYKNAVKNFPERWKDIQSTLERSIIRLRFTNKKYGQRLNIMAGILGLFTVLGNEIKYNTKGACGLAFGSCDIRKLKDEKIYKKFNEDVDNKLLKILRGDKMEFACSSFVIFIWQAIFYLFTETPVNIEEISKTLSNHPLTSEERNKYLTQLKNDERLQLFPLNYRRCLPQNILDVLAVSKKEESNPNWSIKVIPNWTEGVNNKR